MPDATLVLLPGLDGTGELFAPLLAVIPSDRPIRVVSYPCDEALNYSALNEFLEKQLANESSMVLVAESSSGPLALRYAAEHPARVCAIVLCASFIRSPIPKWVRWFVKPIIFRFSPPAFVVRRLMLGRDASDQLVRSVKGAIQTVKPAVLSRRLKEVLEVDCSDALKRCRASILYLAASRDALVRRVCVDAISAIRPDVQVRVIDDHTCSCSANPLQPGAKSIDSWLKNLKWHDNHVHSLE